MLSLRAFSEFSEKYGVKIVSKTVQNFQWCENNVPARAKFSLGKKQQSAAILCKIWTAALVLVK